MQPPKLDPSLPFEDRVLIAVLYRLASDAWEKGNNASFIRAKKALDTALKELARR